MALDYYSTDATANILKNEPRVISVLRRADLALARAIIELEKAEAQTAEEQPRSLAKRSFGLKERSKQE